MEIKPDKRNYRLHGDKNLRLIGKSLQDCGAGRSILIDRDDCIIAGNGVYRKAPALGLALVMRGEHLCKSMRGAKKQGVMTCSALTGLFKTDVTARNEFLQFCG